MVYFGHRCVVVCMYRLDVWVYIGDIIYIIYIIVRYMWYTSDTGVSSYACMGWMYGYTSET